MSQHVDSILFIEERVRKTNIWG